MNAFTVMFIKYSVLIPRTLLPYASNSTCRLSLLCIKSTDWFELEYMLLCGLIDANHHGLIVEISIKVNKGVVISFSELSEEI